MPPTQDANWIYGFLFKNGTGWGKYIVNRHPEIKQVYSLKTETQQIEFLKRYTTAYRKEHRKLITKNKAAYQEYWKRVEKDFFIALAEIMHIDWPRKRKVIWGMISINPICPRFLNEWSFSIFCDYKKVSRVREVTMHESCHFLYFEKWKQLYPAMNPRRFDSPYIEWHLSELLAPVILNDRRIQKLLKRKAAFYPEHERIKIAGKPAPRYFTDLYNRFMLKDDFEGYLKESYRIIKKNQKLFKL